MERFAKVGESQITAAIVRDFCENLLGSVKTDCIVVGAGPSGLVAARELAKEGFNVLLIEPRVMAELYGNSVLRESLFTGEDILTLIISWIEPCRKLKEDCAQLTCAIQR